MTFKNGQQAEYYDAGVWIRCRIVRRGTSKFMLNDCWHIVIRGNLYDFCHERWLRHLSPLHVLAEAAE